MTKIAFIGLGVMGYPMAGHLKRAGYDVCVYNRTQSKAEKWAAEYQGRWEATPIEAATDADFVMTCVGNDDDLRSVVLGPKGALAGMKKDAILVDHTTASANVARELYEVAAKEDISFIDAPVSGGQAGAENGQLGIMVGGDQAAYDTAMPVLKVYAKAMDLMGPVGSGQLTKMVNQICVAGAVQGVAEGLAFAKKSGLDTEQVFDVIQHGAAGSWQMANRHKTMAKGEFEYGFAVNWMRKDLDITLAEARTNGASLPVTALIDQFYAEIQRAGGGRWDTSSLVYRLDGDS